MTSTYKPSLIRRCYLCGTNTKLPHQADSSMLEILRNGRSRIYCPKHWRALSKYAPAELIELHRKEYLPEQDLKNNIHYSRLSKIISELQRMDASN